MHVKDSNNIRVEKYSGEGVDRLLDEVSLQVKTKTMKRSKVIVNVVTNDVC